MHENTKRLNVLMSNYSLITFITKCIINVMNELNIGAIITFIILLCILTFSTIKEYCYKNSELVNINLLLSFITLNKCYSIFLILFFYSIFFILLS